jgi:hypothetical protein
MTDKHEMFCVKCKRHTGSSNLHKGMTKHGRHMLRGTCTVCGTKKARFVGKGFFSDLWDGIKNVGSTVGNAVLPKLADVGGKVGDKLINTAIDKGIQALATGGAGIKRHRKKKQPF